MATIELTAENFEESVRDNETLFVDFWASWCGPCRQFAPTYEAASEANPDLTFGSVNTEEQHAAVQRGAGHLDPDADGLPRRHPGVLPARRAASGGARPADPAVRDLDMDDVRRQIAAQESAESAEG